MANDNDADEVRAIWHSQSADTVRLTPEEITQKVEQMRKKMRRSTYDLYAAVTLTSITMISLAVLFRHPVLTVGVLLCMCGAGYLAFEVRASRRGTPSVPTGVANSLDYQRSLFQHRLDFHRKRLWWRVIALAPGGIVFFIGLAAAQPQLAWLSYLQLLTFVVAISLMVPLNRTMAIRLQREIDELDQLR